MRDEGVARQEATQRSYARGGLEMANGKRRALLAWTGREAYPTWVQLVSLVRAERMQERSVQDTERRKAVWKASTP